MEFLIGVDEAGRGALAGPVAVGVALVPIDFDFARIPGVRDSKQLSPAQRERIFLITQQLKKEEALDFRVAMVGANMIDRVGITQAVSIAIIRALRRLQYPPDQVEVRLDGLLSAPQEYLNQRTIIRGDQTEPVISLASIMAKVTRDRHVVRLSRQYPLYGLDQHKGYGTLAHRQQILKYGLCDLHRKYFCKNFS